MTETPEGYRIATDAEVQVIKNFKVIHKALYDLAGLCHGNSIKRALKAEARYASHHCDGILPLCSSFGSEDPKGGSGDEVALKVEGVVDRTVYAEEALGGPS